MKCIKFYLPGLFFFVLLGGCAQVKDLLGLPDSEVVLSNQAKTYVYECSDGYGFTTSIDGKQAWLFLPEHSIKLFHVPSASGVKYTNQKIMLWSKGDEARLENGTQEHLACKNNRAKAIWEHAKLSGVSFRGLGNEPSWVLELVNGNTIIFSHFYDKINVYVFKKPEPDQIAAKTVYKARNDLHVITVTISGKACQDTMSGESFESSVTVKLDEILYMDCGRALY